SCVRSKRIGGCCSGTPCEEKSGGRGNDGANANAPPKVLRKDYAFVRPKQSTREGKSLPMMGLAADATLITPVDTKGVNGPDPLSYAEPQPHPKQSMTQSYEIPTENVATMEVQDTRSAVSAGSGKLTSSTSMVGSPGEIYQPWLAQQVAMGSQLRLRFEQETSDLKTLLEAETDMNKAAETKNADLTKELESLRSQFLDLQVSHDQLTQQVSTLQAQVTGEEKLKAAFEEFKNYEDDQVKKRCAEIDACLDALSIDFDEESYPHMLTAIAGRRWVIGHGFCLAVMKCGESTELRQVFVDVVSAGITKGMSEGLKYRVEHGKANLDLEAIEAYDPEAETKYVAALHALRDLKYPIVDQLELLKDASIDVIPVYPEVRDPKDPWAFKEEILLADAIAANVSHTEKKKKFRVVCRTHGVGSAHHARSDGVPVLVPTVAPQGLAILLAGAATQTETSDDGASLRLWLRESQRIHVVLLANPDLAVALHRYVQRLLPRCDMLEQTQQGIFCTPCCLLHSLTVVSTLLAISALPAVSTLSVIYALPAVFALSAISALHAVLSNLHISRPSHGVKLLGGPASVDFDFSSELVMKRVTKSIELMYDVTKINDPQYELLLLRAYAGRIVTTSGPRFVDWKWWLATLPFAFGGLGVYSVDIYGDHVVSCVGIVGIKDLHNIVRDTLVDICFWSGILAGKEVDIGLGGGRDKPLRPDDMLLYVALWQSQMEDHTSDWLRVVLIFGLGQTMNACSKVFTRDIYRDHVVSCADIIGIKHRHNVMRDTLVNICFRPGISAGKEVDIGLDGGCDMPQRPADMLLYSWDERLDHIVNGSSTRLSVHTLDMVFSPFHFLRLGIREGCGDPNEADPKVLEHVEILEREFKKLKHSKISIIKVRWNSKRGPEFTWEREDQMKLKYPHLFSDVSSLILGTNSFKGVEYNVRVDGDDFYENCGEL
nr:putative reverse transcriptase domain-containing protein [Tanacetum cinerariifolium]